MNCQLFAARIDDWLTDQATPEMAEHAANCTQCRELLLRIEQFELAVHAWRDVTPVVDLVDSVTSSLNISIPATDGRSDFAHHSSAKVASPPRRPRWFAATVVSAMFVVAGFGVFSIFKTKVSEIADDASSTAQDLRSIPDFSENEPTVVEDAPYTEIVQMAAGAWNEVATIVRPAPPNSAEPDPKQSSSRKRDAWIEGIQHQLQPVGRGLNNAFDFLWQAGKKAEG